MPDSNLLDKDWKDVRPEPEPPKPRKVKARRKKAVPDVEQSADWISAAIGSLLGETGMPTWTIWVEQNDPLNTVSYKAARKASLKDALQDISRAIEADLRDKLRSEAATLRRRQQETETRHNRVEEVKGVLARRQG